MNNNKKLEMLAEEYAITMQHAEDVLNEYVETAYKQALIGAFNELSPDEQMALILALLCESVEESVNNELEDLMDALEEIEREAEVDRYEKERAKQFVEYFEFCNQHGILM